MSTNDGNMLAALAKAERVTKAEVQVPPGYIAIELSTKGKVGAPPRFHVKNFNTKTILNLAIADERELPFKIVPVLNELIFEEGVSVADFHEKEIIETLVRIYHIFFSPTVEVIYPVRDDDIEHLKATLPEGEYLERKQALETGSWSPRIVVDISSLETEELSDDFTPNAHVRKKDGSFEAEFGFPRFGDALAIKRWSDDIFGEEEAKLSHIQTAMEIKNEMIRDFKKGRTASLVGLPDISKSDEQRYREFYEQKAEALVNAVRAASLLSLDGADVSTLSLSEKAKLIHEDGRFDIRVAQKIDKHFESLRFGLKSNVPCVSPVSGKSVERRVSFRLVDILQAIHLYEDDEYDIIIGPGDSNVT